MKKIFTFIVVSLVLVSCSQNNNMEDSTTDLETQQIRLPMGFIPNIQYAPFYVADEKGYFAEAGFEIEFDYSYETDGVNLVGAGELPFAIVSAEQVLLAREQSIPVVYVAAWYQDFPVALVANANTGIEEPADLAGHGIGLPGLFGANYIGLKALLTAGSVAESDVTLNAIGFNQVELFAAGEEDVIVGYISNEPIQLAALGFDINVLPIRDYVKLPANGIITNQDLIDSDPEMIRRFVGAFLHGLADVIADPAAAYDVSVKYVDGLAELDKSIQMEILNVSIEFWQAEELGVSNGAAWRNMQSVLTDMGLLTADLDPSLAFSNDFIK